LKRKFPDVYDDVNQELKDLKEEIKSTENYLERLQKKKEIRIRVRITENEQVVGNRLNIEEDRVNF